MLPFVILANAATALASGVGCSGHHIGRRNNWQAPGAITIREYSATQLDVAAQCAPYNYPPSSDSLSNYPTIWDPATILQNDTEANELFATIKATLDQKLPNAQPKGDPNGAHDGSWGDVETTYGKDDPDCWWTATRCKEPKADTGIPADISTVPEPETWGFGFDDGPNCSHNALYDFLQEQKQKATMFFIGSNVMDWPLQAIRAKNDGHEICIHTWSHRYMTSFSNEQAFAELYYTRKAIKQIIGVTPKCWRPPFGDVDNRIRVIAEGLNLTTIIWSDDTFDWEVGTNGVTKEQVDQNYANIIDKQKNGTYATHGPVVLNHEINNMTMTELIEQYPAIKAAFKHIVPIASAYNITNPYEETGDNYTFPDFNSYIGGNLEGAPQDSANSTGSTGSNSTSGSGTQPSGATVSEGDSKPKSAASRPQMATAVVVLGAALALVL